MSSVSLPAELMQRYRRLFSFYDRDGDGRRDRNHDGTVDGEECLASHGRVFAAFQADLQAAREFMARSAGGFFDVLDLDGDGQLDLDDLAAFAAA